MSLRTHRLALLGAVAAGALLRAWSLGGQVISDDEFHGFQAAVQLGAWDLLAHLKPHGHEVDYSVPLALWNRLLLQTTGLEEWGFRLPVLIGGILLVPAAAWLVSRRLGRFAGVLTAWLVALSPPLVLYSRFARPYTLIALLVLLALACWLRWRETGAARFGLASALAGASAVFANLVAAPALLAVWGYGGLVALVEWRAGRGASSALRWSAWVALGVGLSLFLLWPGLDANRSFVASKAESAWPGLATCWGGAQMLFGTRSPPVLIGLLALTLFGAGVAYARDRLLTGAIVVACVAQLVAILALGPDSVDDPFVLARYLLPILPGLLVFEGLGLARLAEAAGRRAERARPAVAIAGLAALVLAGPLPGLYRGTNSFMSHPFHYVPARWTVDLTRASPIYRRIAADPKVRTVTEAPWILETWRTIYGAYQQLHGKPVTTLTAVNDFVPAQVAFRGVTALRRARPDFEGFDVIVVHKDIAGEWLYVTGGSDPAAARRWTSPLYRQDAELILENCRASPNLQLVYEDEWLAVFEPRAPGADAPSPPS
jgi:4-amino-4-deoxy-L-arabinose transferase-like glycosyltransferase